MNWEVIGYIGGFITIIGFIIKLFERIAKVETKVELFWGTMQKLAVDALHSPHTPEFDVLLEKWKQGDLTDKVEMERLKRLLLDEKKTDDKTRQFFASLIFAGIEFNGGKK